MNITESLDNVGIDYTDHGIPGYGTPGNSPNGRRSFQPIGLIVHYPVGIDDKGVDNVLKLVIRGRTRAPAPIYSIYIDHLDASIHVISNGRANHAGGGMGIRIREAKADRPPTAPNGPDDHSGNKFWYGMTLEGPPTTSEQRTTAARVAAAICLGNKWTHNRVIGHKEWSPQDKMDPDFDMVWFRSEVEREMGSIISTHQYRIDVNNLWLQIRGTHCEPAGDETAQMRLTRIAEKHRTTPGYLEGSLSRSLRRLNTNRSIKDVIRLREFHNKYLPAWVLAPGLEPSEMQSQ